MASKKWVWKETAEVLGVVGIIAGIIFLGYELRQNNELMAAEARATRLSMQTELWRSLSENSEIPGLLIKDRSGELLTVEEEFRLNSFWMHSLLNLEWQFETTPEYNGWIEAIQRNFETYRSLQRTWSGDGTGSRSAGKTLL